ncbi:MAG: tryptophan--tRNA ligase [Planctomycetes bacterium]|jgi:tryptophanyl-tRNA synthetase|nr:tryptophan--tRNA ligase [Planctomycetota bacterium]MDP6425173.1 tryptophan--tRNA ligase [Planctomycetota bacterium]
MKRILSGMQPTGSAHLGNYLGAIRNWVDMQDEYECFYSVVDLHALTTRPSAEKLRSNVLELTIALLASGVDPERSVLFVQSAVKEHAELAWILSCHTVLGDLNRMTQFKEKTEDDPGVANAGLYTYPILQAADIMVYRATHVPVGEDQNQHLELTREVARRFRHHYGELFPEPAAVNSPTPRVLGVDGQTKMSKSKGNHIGLLEEADEVMAKLRGAVTDPQRLRRTDPGCPEVCNLWSLHGSFTPDEQQKEIHEGCTTATIGCVDCKKMLCDNIIAHTEPIRERARALRADPDGVMDVLRQGNEKARAEASATMALVRERVGIWDV